MFFSICTNIFIFTLSVGLIDKSIIMIFMMSIALLLILWDWKNIKLLFGRIPLGSVIDNYKKVSVSFQKTGTILFIVVIIFFLLADTYY